MNTTANGIADKTPDEILTAAKAAATAASSVKVTTEASKDSTAPSVNLTLSQDGSQGTIGTPSQGEVELISTGGNIYIKATDELFKQLGGAEAAKLFKGKWLAIPAKDPQAQSFAPFANKNPFLEGLLTPSGKMTKEAPKDVNGTPAVGLATSNGTLWVATVGEAYPLQVAQADDSGAVVSLSDWDAPVTITAPPSDQIVDLSALKEGVS